jgi:hypothetical protein
MRVRSILVSAFVGTASIAIGVLYLQACVGDEPIAPTTKPAPTDAGTQAMDDGGCTTDEKVCGDRCVKIDDPVYGCSGTACGPCAEGPFVASLRCDTGQCKVGACVEGREDCDNAFANGCETDVTTSQACGTCTNECLSAKPNCTNDDAGALGCSATCSMATPISCDGGTCSNTAIDPLNCGSCGKQCAKPTNGRATCIGSACGKSCSTGSDLSSDGAACITNLKTCLRTNGICEFGVQCCTGVCDKKTGAKTGVCTACENKGTTCTRATKCCSTGRGCPFLSNVCN